MAMDYMNSKPYLAEKHYGWDRKTVALGLNELRTGLVCFDNFKARGNKKTEAKMPQLEIDIVALAEPESQIDPKFQTVFKYTRITAKAMRCSATITLSGRIASHNNQTTEEPPYLIRLGFNSSCTSYF